MRKRGIVCLLLWITAIGMVFAQETDTKKINSIKRNNQYIYAEATMSTENEAYAIAEELLTTYINEYIDSKKKLSQAENVIVKDVSGKCDKIQMMRGEMYRVFVYVNKSDIIPAENVVTFVKPESANPEASVESANKHNAAGGDGNEALKLETAWQQALVDELLATSSLAGAKAVLNRLKVEYKVKRYGNYSECSNPADCFWLIIDENNLIQTVLGPGMEQRVNFRLMQYDSLKNHSGSNAIWFTLSK